MSIVMYCLQNTVELIAKQYAIEPKIPHTYALANSIELSSESQARESTGVFLFLIYQQRLKHFYLT